MVEAAKESGDLEARLRIRARDNWYTADSYPRVVALTNSKEALVWIS